MLMFASASSSQPSEERVILLPLEPFIIPNASPSSFPPLLLLLVLGSFVEQLVVGEEAAALMV